MKCMGKTAGYAWMDYKINIEIAKELIMPGFGQYTGQQKKFQ